MWIRVEEITVNVEAPTCADVMTQTTGQVHVASLHLAARVFVVIQQEIVQEQQ